MAVVLDHAQHRHIQSAACQHLLGHTGVLLTAVDQQQVRQGGKLFIAVQIAPEPAGEHLMHGTVVVGAGAGLDAEAAVGGLQRLAVLKDHHAAHLVRAAGVGDIIALHAPGQDRQLSRFLQKAQGAVNALYGVGNALHLLPGVAVGDVQQRAALTSLGDPEGHGVAAALRQQGGERVSVIDGGGKQYLTGQRLAGQIVLGHHSGKQGALAVGSVGEHLGLPGQEIAVFNVENGAAGPGGAGIRAPDIGVGADTGDDLLVLGQHGQGPYTVAEGGSRLEVQGLRRRGHPFRQLGSDGAQLALQQGGGLGHAAAVFRRVRTVRAAEAVTPAHVEVQAGALLADVAGEPSGTGGQAQGGAHGVQRQARFVPAAEGTVVFRAVVGGAVHQGKAGVVAAVQPHEGIALVILQQNVVAGLMALDEGILQHQGLELRPDDNGVEPVHMGHHHLRFLVVAGGVLKVLADAVFQFFGLAHIDDLAGLVHHQIDAGQQGQVVGLGAELITGHGVISFMENYRYGDSIPPPRPLGKGWKYRKVQRKACGGEKAVARRGRM